MALTLFDLDNTLLAGDSDYLWGCFLAQQGIVDGATYERANAQFYQDYHAGTLDIAAFLRFSLRPLRDQPRQRLEALRQHFIAEQIVPIMLPAAQALIAAHRAAGDTLVIITATNAFVTAPIAECFGIAHLIATEPAEMNGSYTGEVAGIPAFQQGKVLRLEQWLATHGGDLRGSTFYSDSHNDLPLLERVEHPIAVDPDPQLRAVAEARGWPLLSLREQTLARSDHPV